MVTVRLAVPDDAEAVVAVGHATWPPTYEPFAGPEFVRRGLEAWWTVDFSLPAIEERRTLVAVEAGADGGSQVIGMAAWSYDGDTVTIFRLYVLPAFQGRGAGSALLHGVVREVSPNAKIIRLAFLDGNEAARGFYEANGFAVTTREPGELDGPDNVWMERAL
jgi:ribosomal protein S18 acetylase RimI-like enzyme